MVRPWEAINHFHFMENVRSVHEQKVENVSTSCWFHYHLLQIEVTNCITKEIILFGMNNRGWVEMAPVNIG